MLILTRGLGEDVLIDHRIRVRVVAVFGQQVRIGVCAPASVPVDHDELDGEYRDAAGYPVFSRVEGEVRP
ncbi:MAG: carbon storage regulator [Planctomycetia bacterium]|nr:carbon storage regulator [Planctomycetia bacterium]